MARISSTLPSAEERMTPRGPEIMEVPGMKICYCEMGQQKLESATDRLGRRAFSGIVVGSLLISGAILLSQESYRLGGLAVAAGAFYGAAHTARLWLLGKPRS